MTPQAMDRPGQVSTLERGADLQPQVVRRATQLCARAEPHTDQSPCPAHLTEAQRQLFRLSV